MARENTVPMRSGELRNKIEIQQAESVRDKVGGIRKNWVTYATIWAAIEPLRGTEAMVAQQVKATLTHRVAVRYDSRISARHRVKFGSRILEINQVRNLSEQGRQLELICSEVVG